MADRTQYKSGTPDRKGWYKVLIDGEIEMTLYFFICELNPRKRYWVMPDGSQLSMDEVKYLPR